MSVLKILTLPQDALLTTSRTISERCTQFASDIAPMLRFVNLVEQLKAIIGKIDAAMIVKQASKSTNTVTKQKNDSIEMLLNDLHDLAYVILDMAEQERNEDWAAKAKSATVTKNKTTSEESQLVLANEFIQFVQTIKPELLAYYDIDAAELLSIHQQVKDAYAWRVRKQVTTHQKSLDNSTLAGLFAELKLVKSQMARLISRFKKKSPEFYAAYLKADNKINKTGSKITRNKPETPALPNKTTDNPKKNTKKSPSKPPKNDGEPQNPTGDTPPKVN